MAVLHEPLWMLWFSLPVRMWRGRSYLKTVKDWTGEDWQAVYREALKEFARDFSTLVETPSATEDVDLATVVADQGAHPAYQLPTKPRLPLSRCPAMVELTNAPSSVFQPR